MNKLKGAVTMIFIAHQLPRTLKVDHIVRIDADDGTAKQGGAVIQKMPSPDGGQGGH